jgi:hypothetical protein
MTMARHAQMSKTYEHWNTIMDEYDMDIDSQDERALNIMRRERSDPTYAPDEPVPVTLKPFDGAPGSSEGVIKYTYMKELTTVSEVIEDVSEHIGVKVYEISLVRAGLKMSQKQWTLSDYGVKADYVVYYKVEHVTVF